MRLTRFFAVVLLCAAAGCAPTIMAMTVAPADRQAAEAALGAGDATIQGSAVIRQRGGGTVDCAGNEVFLIPATVSVTRELVRVFGSEQGYVERGGDTFMGGGTLVSPPEPNRQGMCNAQGFFTFGDVRPGKWHVMTSVAWTVGDNNQGGTLLATTEVGAGKTAEVVLTTR